MESKLVVDMAKTIIYPAAMSYLAELAETSSSAAGIGITLDTSVASTIAEESNAMMAAVAKLSEAMAKEDFASIEEHMTFCANEIRGQMDEIRLHADALEVEIADAIWPLPKYREMLFIK